MFHPTLHWLDLVLLSSAIVLFLAWIGSWLQQGPQRRQRWCEAGIALSLLAAATVFVPIPRPSVFAPVARITSFPPSTPMEVPSIAAPPPRQVDTVATVQPELAASGAPVPATQVPPMRSPIPWRHVLTGGYLAGSGLCILFLVVGRWRLIWIEAAAQRCEDSLEVPSTVGSRISLLISPRAHRPFCYGIFRSRIVLPTTVADSNHRQHVLRHELVHLKRRDALTRAMMNIAMPLLYLNPFYWLLRRSAILASEHVADAQAAEATSVEAYSTGMIELARMLKTRRSELSVIGGWTSPTALTKRVQWLLRKGCESAACTKRWSCATGCLAVCLLCVVTLLFGCAPEAVRRGDVETVEDSIAGCLWSMTPDLPGSAARIKECEVKVVSGRVLDEDGPVADAEIWASGYGRIGGREKVVSDSEGRFQLSLPIDPRMAIRSWHIAAFEADRFGRSGIVSDNGQITINLARGRAIEIEVRDRSTDESIHAARLFLDDGRIVDAPDGRARISGLPNDLYKMVAVAKGFARRSIQVDLHALDQDRLIVKLNQGGRIHGKVVDRRGRPVAGNPVGLGISSMSLQPAMRQFTDDDGNYSLDGLPVNQPLGISTYSHQISGGSTWESATVTVPDNGSLEVDFSVDGDHAAPPEAESPGIRALYSDEKDPGRGAIRGRVLLPDGEPATEFELSFEWPRDWKPGEEIISGGAVGNACLFTPADGRFEFTGLKKGGTYRLVAAAPGFQDAIVSRVHAVAITDLATANPIEMKLKPTVDLIVTVNDRAKQSISAADVWLVSKDPQQALDTHKFNRRRIHGQTDLDGQVKFSAVPFANGVLIVEKDGMGIEQAPWDGNDTTVMLSKSAKLKVQLTRPNGSPKRVDVFLQREGSNNLTAKVAKPTDQSVAFEDVTSAKYTLSIDSNDYSLAIDQWQQPIGMVEPGSTKTVTLKLKARKH